MTNAQSKKKLCYGQTHLNYYCDASFHIILVLQCTVLFVMYMSSSEQICAYFTSPSVCIGPVAANQVRDRIEHTAGEKRMSGHPDYHHLRK